MSNEKKIIFVVDDDETSLTACKQILKPYYVVYPIPSAVRMFDLLDRITPDLILLDVELFGINGFETVKLLKKNVKYSNIPVIFISIRSDAMSEMEGLNLGAVDYIHKPIVSSLLLRRLELHLSLLENKKKLQEQGIAIEELLKIKTQEVSQRQAAEAQALQTSRTKAEFLSRMSHEIRTPLNGIIGMIRIAMETDNSDKIKNCLIKANNASMHLLALINDILDLSRIEAGKLTLSYNDFNFENMLNNVRNVINDRAEAKQQKLIIHKANDVPDFINSDEHRLSQVITNLLTNAVMFSPEDSHITLYIKKAGETENEVKLQIEVADSGSGLSEKEQLLIFASFEMGESSISQRFGGTRLGLIISKHIVELMNGSIWIESKPGNGSKFIFTVNIKKGEADSAGQTEENKKDNNFDFSGITILAAEDNDLNREILFALLEKTKVAIDFAVNGKIAVSMFKDNPGKYALILMDIQMPEMDGYEATREIREIESEEAKNIPIIAMTANVLTEDIEACLASGMNDHLGKPVNPDELLRVIRKYFG